MFCLFVLANFFQPSGNTLLSLRENAPVAVVLMAFFISWVVCWLPLAVISAIVMGWQPTKPLQSEQKLPLIVTLYLLAPLVLWGVIWLFGRSFAEYGLGVNLSLVGGIGIGFGLGLFSLAMMFAVELGLGWCEFAQANIKLLPSILLPILLVALLVGGVEELVFRGFLFTELERNYPIWIAATISSCIFAILHLVWEQQETLPQVPGLWLMGMMLVMARIADKGSLGIAWGLHTALVLAIATIDTAQLITYTGKVPEWWTGKYKKPLAGLAGVFCVLGTSLILYLGSL
ncbi:CPBP family intramembrane glutamic endopeptidase [Aulosira sp. FACHB-615]|uniref:CPBP family intramembrane glutamic endopeptidase n=1 Tax=Aulosira sp. FACHB-615 TaxID=2692777 RepID=UPI0028C3B271|nr:CPBP family intramembrane glutamic endopeptidase [Aulosira sp. FACHB-615]